MQPFQVSLEGVPIRAVVVVVVRIGVVVVVVGTLSDAGGQVAYFARVPELDAVVWRGSGVCKV